MKPSWSEPLPALRILKVHFPSGSLYARGDLVLEKCLLGKLR